MLTVRVARIARASAILLVCTTVAGAAFAASLAPAVYSAFVRKPSLSVSFASNMAADVIMHRLKRKLEGRR